ncbi:hypothetical protein IH979_02630 [Patescibacteria group bacterium]|nr:hypothetical protein [Patescibacteria group bacterium]
MPDGQPKARGRWGKPERRGRGATREELKAKVRLSLVREQARQVEETEPAPAEKAAAEASPELRVGEWIQMIAPEGALSEMKFIGTDEKGDYMFLSKEDDVSLATRDTGETARDLAKSYTADQVKDWVARAQRRAQRRAAA